MILRSVHCGRLLLLCFLLSGPFNVSASSVTQGEDPDTHLRYWQLHSEGVLFRLTQRLPDQTRGFFLARGFDRDSADLVALSCVFQTMLKNTGTNNTDSIEFDMTEWHVRAGGGQHHPIVREDWQAKWTERQLPQSARIAFEWALLPTRQRYAPGDYNWGMTAMGLPPGARFDLELTWRSNGRRVTRLMQGIECPADIHPQPD